MELGLIELSSMVVVRVPCLGRIRAPSLQASVCQEQIGVPAKALQNLFRVAVADAPPEGTTMQPRRPCPAPTVWNCHGVRRALQSTLAVTVTPSRALLRRVRTRKG